jgi:hypothetical protein
MPYESEAAEAFESEAYESEGIGEWGEAARRRLPRTATGRGLATAAQPQSRNFVTYSALRQALDKVGMQIKTNSDAITSVGVRMNSTAAALKKEAEDRKKEADTARGDINQKVSMLALLPLIMGPPTYTIPAGTAIGVDTVTNNPVAAPVGGLAIAPPPVGTANALLPILLIGGLGGSGGTAAGGMDTTMLLVLALVLANPGR